MNSPEQDQSAHAEIPFIDPDFLSILVCPQCKTTVSQETNFLVCQNPECRLKYPIVDGIPVMLVEEATKAGS